MVAIFGGSQPKLPIEQFPRLLLAMFLIFFLVMRSAYQGLLFKFLQTDSRNKAVESIDDMIEQEFDIFMYLSQLNLFENQPNFSKLKSR